MPGSGHRLARQHPLDEPPALRVHAIRLSLPLACCYMDGEPCPGCGTEMRTPAGHKPAGVCLTWPVPGPYSPVSTSHRRGTEESYGTSRGLASLSTGVLDHRVAQVVSMVSHRAQQRTHCIDKTSALATHQNPSRSRNREAECFRSSTCLMIVEQDVGDGRGTGAHRQ